ncbi:putative integral membrane protein [Theileria parva strain Muguga]|uniref:putative integral membrane protein n=1 Tax=Theileria parva strain Muguga TaxID=333668 RepID=UPI001C6228D0|nr:putative integral membrane protein [Theileria parva strain Muguga]EAN30679.2 putative integral membrane protein [Theileria parva strain Muguga]
MRCGLSKYVIKLTLVLAGLVLLGAIFNLGNMTDLTYNARQSILSLTSHSTNLINQNTNLTDHNSNLTEQNSNPKESNFYPTESSSNLTEGNSGLIDNNVEDLEKFYKGLISGVAEWKIPRNYSLTQANLTTTQEEYDLLEMRERELMEVRLKGNVKFTLKLVNQTTKINTEMIKSVEMSDVGVWEVSEQVTVNIEERKYLYISSILSIVFLLLLLCVKRTKMIFTILGFLSLFLGITAAKLFLPPILTGRLLELYVRCVGYLKPLASVCILIVLISYYFHQASELGKYNEMHLMFSHQFRNLVVTVISVVLSIFNHKIAVNVVNWFIWVPILQCYVFQNYQQIINRKCIHIVTHSLTKETKETEQIELVGEFDVLKIEETESLQEYSDFHQRRRKNFRPYLMLLYLILFLTSLVLCFKNTNYFNSTKEIDEAMSDSFYVNMETLNIQDFNLDQDNINFTITKSLERVLLDDISEITTVELLNGWIESFLKRITFKNSLIVFKDLDNPTEYKLLNQDNTKDLTKINLSLLFIFQANNQITTAEIKIGSSKVSTTLKNLGIITFGLVQNKYLGILIFFNCLVLLAALAFTGGKDKSKFKAAIIILLFIISLCFSIAFFFLIPKLLYNIDTNFIKDPSVSMLSEFLSPLLKLIFLRKAVTVIVFICLVLSVVYLIISLPKEYSTFNENMTSVKRSINSDWKNLRILLYQFLLLLLISAVIGHESFGYKYDEFRNELLSLRYNFIMMFNKFLIEPRPDIRSLLYWYHRVGIFVFYNVVLTGFLATFYFYSCSKRGHLFSRNKNFFVFPKPSDFNFDVKIKATFEEILAFKVFLESFNSYKEHLKSTENNDVSERFVETFSQKMHGLNKLTFNGDLYVYFERVKRYLLCIIFLRIKINSFTEKIKALELQKDKIKNRNDNKRTYLIMLKKKLFDTTEEVEKFKAKYKILQLIQANQPVNSDSVISDPVVPKSVVQETEEIKKYDTKELKEFLLIPELNNCNTVESVESVESSDSVSSVDDDTGVDSIESIKNEVKTTNEVINERECSENTLNTVESDTVEAANVVEDSTPDKSNTPDVIENVKKMNSEVLERVETEEKVEIGIFKTKILKSKN